MSDESMKQKLNSVEQKHINIFTLTSIIVLKTKS